MQSELKPRLRYEFDCFGHRAIRATHVKTLEFTKDTELTERGDCILGIKATFERDKLKQFSGKVKLTCRATLPSGEVVESVFKCKVNPGFADDHELVLRKSGFNSPRTFGFGLNRGANHLDRRLVEYLQTPGSQMRVVVEEGWV